MVISSSGQVVAILFTTVIKSRTDEFMRLHLYSWDWHVSGVLIIFLWFKMEASLSTIKEL